MDPQRWQTVEEIFHAVMESEESERSAVLDRACAGDEALRREVESLLQCDQRAGQILEKPAFEVVAEVLAQERLRGDEAEPPGDDRMIGARIAQYQIVAKLGAGGMGLVYRAVRADDQYQQQVAIKVVRAGGEFNAIVRRFKNERQILAGLAHPNIARLLDGGITKDGTPYFVMELIEGESIDKYCDSRQLGIPERQKLFLQVCSAVQYAHQRQIIHRDIKPANILVNSEGEPKLLDFGIAKILDAGAFAGVTGPTLTGFHAFTPEYASPEQVKAETITAASDIYSLGVLLYELLTGRRPYQFKTRSRSEIERAICEKEPLKPSIAVTRAEDQSLADDTSTSIAPNEISRARGGDPESVRSCLLGDLDAIILMALRKEPHRRYASVTDLSDDIRRHLDGLLIAARPSTITYRAFKFVRRHAELAMGTVVFLLLLGGLSIWEVLSHQARPLTEKDTIVLADFDNKTGDPVFDDALKQALAVELGQSPFLNILSDRKVNATLRMMNRPANERIVPDVARELCLRAGSQAVLQGTISSMGTHYLIDLNAVACSTGETLAREQADASSKERVLKSLSRAASSLRSKLGESLPSVQKFDVPLEVTTSSLEALKNYSMGIKIGREKGEVASIPFFRRAIELDPDFPVAYAALAGLYGNLQQPSLALEYATKAYQLRDRVTEREKLRISTTYFHVTGDVEKATQTFELWTSNYPRDSIPRGDLGVNYTILGQYEKALTEFQETLRLAPEDVNNYANLGYTYVSLDRLDEAQATFNQALAHKLDGGWLRQNLQILAFLRGDAAQMEQQLAWGTGRPGDEDLLLSVQSDTEAYYGRVSKARDFSRRAADSAIRADDKETAASWQINAALRESELGNAAHARQGVTAALGLASGRVVKVTAALARARIGDASQAKAMVAELEKSYPDNTMLKVYWLPTINAAIEIGKGNSSQALMDLEATAPYELAGVGGNLYPAYERGQAYLLAHNGSAAAAEFQKMLDHRGIVQNFVTGALAHLQIGRAYAMAGDTAKAKAAYQDFFFLWKDADPDIPILKEAKQEFAKLKQPEKRGRAIDDVLPRATGKETKPGDQPMTSSRVAPLQNYITRF